MSANRLPKNLLPSSFGFALVFMIALSLTRSSVAYEGPSGLLVDLLEKTDVVWRDGYPTQLTLDELPTAIERLQTVEIRSSRPYLSWVVPAVEKNMEQTAYRLQFATSRKAFAEPADAELLWDSGKVADASSTAVPYGAEKPLEPSTVYYWRVKIWDRNDAESDWSAVKAFKTASELEEYATSRYPLVKKTDAPVKTTNPNANMTFVDFGRASFGQLRVKVDAPKDGLVALVRLGERTANGAVDRKPKGTTRYWEYRLRLLPGVQTYSIKTRVDKRNSSGAAFLMPDYIGEVMPFRYAEIEFLPDQEENRSIIKEQSAPKLVAVERETVVYPFDSSASYFHCGNDALNRVWDLCQYSIEATSFDGVYLDGDRERIPYEGDAFLNQLSHYSVDHEYTLARFSEEYLIFHPTWPTEWNLQNVQMAWYDYLYTGDVRHIAKYYDELKAKSLVALAEENGLISTRKGKLTQEVLDSIHFKGGGFRDIVDWPHSGLAGNENEKSGETDGFVFNDFNAVVNAYHFFALNSMKKFATILGKDDDVKFFDDQIAKVKRSYQEVFFDADRGIYKDGEATDHASLHSNMFALAFGLVPRENVESVAKFVQSRGPVCSVYGAQFLLDATYQGDNGDYGLALMTSDGLRGWLNMLKAGSTITMEAWDDRYKPNQDWNHAWGAAPANIIPRKLVGVEPTSPGCATIQIKPQIASLKTVEAIVPTIRGTVEVSVDQSEPNSFALAIQTPGNVKADVYLPAVSDDDLVYVDGVRLDAPLRDGAYWKIPNVGAGATKFERVSK